MRQQLVGSLVKVTAHRPPVDAMAAEVRGIARDVASRALEEDVR
jgi:hypothetical protein